MTTRPETGDIRPGMTMYVRRSPNDSRRRPASNHYIEVTVSSAARVWITVTDGRREWRMRRDTMNEGTRYSGNNASLVTCEQKVWDDRQASAVQLLRDQGINLSLSSPWQGREQALADLIGGGVA